MIFNVPIITIVGFGCLFVVITFGIFVLNPAEMFNAKRENEKFVNLMLTIIAFIIIFGSIIWWYNGTESGKRSAKTWQSNIDSGITRTVRVYDMDGDLLQEYTGKFDIDFSDNERILFDDEEGNRHVIYFKTGTVIVDEVDDE